MSIIAGFQSLIIVRHRNHTGHDDRALQRSAARGDLTRLRSGAYVPTAVWKLLSPADRRRLEAAAMAEVHIGFVACHRSAAALWHIPTILKPDGLVHARVTQAAGTRTEHGVRKHAVRKVDLHLTSVDGITCTTLERTVLDIAATEPFAEAVVALDWVLRHHTDEARLREALEEWDPVRGRRRVEAALEFADPRSGSAGESWSRVQMDEGGLPAPELQHEFSDTGGLIGYVDFWWPEFNLIGEFDGLKKYREAEFLRGRTSGEVVTEEKIREDRLRSTANHPGVDRWIWATLIARGSLVQHLVAAGLPRLR